MTIPPNAWYVDSVGWTAVTAWPANTAKAAGSLIRQNATPTVGNERVFVCIVAGTTAAVTEPTWTVTKGAKTTDNTATWQECTGQPGVNGDLTNTPVWAATNAVVLGQIIYDSNTSSLQICSTAGTSSSSAPSFSGTAGTVTSDGAALKWTSLGAASNFAAWAAPAARLGAMLTLNWAAAGNSVFVGDDHAETQSTINTCGGQIGSSSSPILVYCVDHTAAVPPGAANLKTTATITTTSSSAINFLTGQSWFYVYGLVLNSAANLTVGSSSTGWTKCEACTLKAPSGNVVLASSGNSFSALVELENTTMQLGGASALLRPAGRVYWRNTASALAGTVPTSGLIDESSGAGVGAVFEGVDLSALSGSDTLIAATFVGNGTIAFVDCALGSGAALISAPAMNNNGVTFELVRSDSAATIYRQSRTQYAGQLDNNQTVVRSGGASDGVTSISWQIVTTANALWIHPFEAMPISIWNTATGANRTVTLYGIVNAAAVPNTDDIWIDVAYLGDSGSPMASFANSTKANNLATGSALSADTSAWDSGATARQNSTLYALGNVIKVADNPGRVFFCTTAGTTAGSEPAGYASAVDGGSVTDNTAHFRAGCRFSMAVTLSSPKVQIAGYMRITVKAARVSTTFFVDPQPILH